MDFDLLIGAGCVAKVPDRHAAFEVFGMAPNFRKKSEKGEIVTKEGACQPIHCRISCRRDGPAVVTRKRDVGLRPADDQRGGRQPETDEKDPCTQAKTMIAVRGHRAGYCGYSCPEGATNTEISGIEGPFYEDVIKAKAAKKVGGNPWRAYSQP